MPYSSSPVRGLEKLTLCITYQCTKFEVSSLSHSIDIWQCEILKWVTQGYKQLIIRQSAYDFLFNFNRNYASILYHLRDAVLYLSKVANFHLPHLHLAPPLRVTQFECQDDPWHQKVRSTWVIMQHCLHNHTFSHCDTIPACDRRMDRQTHDNSMHHAIRVHVVKTICKIKLKLKE